MKADLHLHSYCSDGKYSPMRVVELAARAGMELIALTDHDSMAGCDEAAAAAKIRRIAFVPGWEISAYESDCKVHILGYGCKQNEAYRAFLAARVAGAKRRAEEMLSRGNRYFSTDVRWGDIEAFHTVKTAPIHTMHVVNAFASKLKRDPTSVYVKAFVRGKSAYSNVGRPTTREAIEVIHKMGGKAVLAHPGRILLFNAEEETAYYNEPDLRAFYQRRSDARRDLLLHKLRDEGLDGIECYHTAHTVEDTGFFRAFAKDHGLLITGGSDFHQEGERAAIGQPPFDASASLYELLSKGSR